MWLITANNNDITRPVLPLPLAR